MNGSLTNTLCTQCGLCCDGSLFSDVELANAEGSGLEVLGLDVEDGDGVRELLLQPCGALKGKRCSIYAHRPGCCRTFECRLLQQVQRGEVTIDQAQDAIAKALRQIQAVKALIGQFSGTEGDKRLPLKERFSDALTLSEDVDIGSQTHRREMQRAMRSVENLIHRTFLGP